MFSYEPGHEKCHHVHLCSLISASVVCYPDRYTHLLASSAAKQVGLLCLTSQSTIFSHVGMELLLPGYLPVLWRA